MIYGQSKSDKRVRSINNGDCNSLKDTSTVTNRHQKVDKLWKFVSKKFFQRKKTFVTLSLN